jgi:putative ABC transport system permease protein
MEENIATSVNEPRFRATLLGIFAGSALLLSVIGLYGVMMYTVTQRIPEIGIRLTLGAQRGEILAMVIRQGLQLACCGVVAGVAGALLLTRLLAQFLYGVAVTDLATYIVVSVLLVAVAVIACYIPARRATRIDPIAALRSE